LNFRNSCVVVECDIFTYVLPTTTGFSNIRSVGRIRIGSWSLCGGRFCATYFLDICDCIHPYVCMWWKNLALVSYVVSWFPTTQSRTKKPEIDDSIVIVVIHSISFIALFSFFFFSPFNSNLTHCHHAFLLKTRWSPKEWKCWQQMLSQWWWYGCWVLGRCVYGCMCDQKAVDVDVDVIESGDKLSDQNCHKSPSQHQ
jgi:hypothetical protein